MAMKHIEFKGKTTVHWKVAQEGNYYISVDSGKPNGGEQWLSIDTKEFYSDQVSKRSHEKRTMVSLKGEQLKQLRDFLNSLDI